MSDDIAQAINDSVHEVAAMHAAALDAKINFVAQLTAHYSSLGWGTRQSSVAASTFANDLDPLMKSIRVSDVPSVYERTMRLIRDPSLKRA